MKISVMMFVLAFAISCISQNTDQAILISSNPFLIGKWTGEGHFLDVDFNKEVGPVYIEIEIKEDKTIHGKVGDARLINTSIAKASYGFEIRGRLDATLIKGSDLTKDHVIILLVLPEENRQEVTSSDANFHLKSNYTFDFGMRVGGVILAKEL